jgi:TRAP transporter TAXI family solute receptor
MSGPSRKRDIGKRGTRCAAALIFCALLLGAHVAIADDSPHFFRIGTAATTGTYFQIGAEVANAISKPPGSRDCARGGSCGVEGLVAVAQATQGSIDNAIAVGAGQLEAAFVQADVAFWAYSGTTPAITGPGGKACRGAAAMPGNGAALMAKTGAIKNLRAIAALYPEAVHILSRDPKIKTVGDLKTKRVSLGEGGSGTLAEARLVLEANGLNECQMKAQYPRLAEAASLLQKDGLDALFLIGGAPVPAITDAASMIPVHLLPVTGKARETLIRRFPFIAPYIIPGATYPGIDAETQTIAVPALFVVNAAVSDELVFGITKALWQDSTRRMLDNGHPAGKNIRIANALTGLAIPLHPGAAKYYQQAGLTLPETPAPRAAN